MTFPTVDLSRSDPAEVDRVCRDTGFLAIVGHAFPETLIDEMWQVTRAFFDLPLERKMRVAMPSTGCLYGYAPFAEEALAQSLDEMEGHTPPDLKETFSIGPEASWTGGEFPTLWPDEPEQLQEIFRRYFKEMGGLAARIMSLFATALELPPDFFASKFDRHASAVRVLNYPALDKNPRPGQLRAGAHSDYGSVTILLAEAGSRGLEIRIPGGGWQPVPIEEGAFVVNVGDLLARWSNDRWVSTVHRVTCEPSRRQSIAFFHLPNWDAEIACIPGETPNYAPVIAGEHLMEKFGKAMRH